jgi:hypothetical protein
MANETVIIYTSLEIAHKEVCGKAKEKPKPDQPTKNK